MNVALVKDKARELGFTLCGIAPATDTPNMSAYDWWLEQGFAADMGYMRRQRDRRQTVQNILPGAQAVVMCALPFPGSPPSDAEQNYEEPANKTGYGKVARYAQGPDYHDVVKAKLEALAVWLDAQANIGKADRSLAYVDTGAIQERSLAAAAGLGWIGKNAMLIHPDEGSWFWLGEVITKVELPFDRPLTDHCGRCRRCIEACPTDAIIESQRAIDSRRCLSYLNIEHRGDIPTEFHEPMQDWLLGCDICQEVCPWNEKNARRLRQARQESPPPVEWVYLNDLSTMEQAEFKTRFKHRAHSRPKLAGLQRNAAIINANQTRDS